MASQLLATGAGAAEGLETLLARLMAEEKFAEQKRSTLAEEDYRRQALGETSALRQQQQQSLDQSRRALEESRIRDDIRGTLNMRPTGTVVDPAQFQYETGRGGAPADLYTPIASGPDPTAVAEGIPASLAQNAPPTGYEFAGTAQSQQAGERLAQQRELAQMRDEMARERESRLASYGPPVVIIGDPSSPGGVRYSPRAEAVGQPGPPTGAARTALSDAEVALETVDRLIAGYNEDFIGPVAGRLRTFGAALPSLGGINPIMEGFPEFQSNSAILRNSVIKAITGAQMSEPEAVRIRQQIPEISDRPEVWTAKMKATKQNLTDLLEAKSRGVPLDAITRARSTPATAGQPAIGAPPTPAADPYEEYLRRTRPPQ